MSFSWKSYREILMILFLVSTFYWKNLQPLLLGFMFLEIFFNPPKLDSVKSKISFKNAGVWLFLLFLMHLLGTFYSEHKSDAWEDVGMKLSLLVIPVYFVLIRDFDKKRFMDQFSIIGFSSAVVCLLYAMYSIFILRDNLLSRESDFSLFMHRSYQGVYWSVASMWCFNTFFFAKVRKWVYGAFAIILALATILTFSKAGIITLFVFGLAILINAIIKLRKPKIGLIAVIFTTLFVLCVNSISKKPLARLERMVQTIIGSEEENQNDSNSTRIKLWKASNELISENWMLGVGTGDVHYELNKINTKNGDMHLVEKNLNSHNQFLNTGVALGIVGIILIVGAFCIALLFGKIHQVNKIVVVAIVGSLAFFFFTESAFETQAGVVICTFVLSMITFSNNENLNRNSLS